MSLVLRKPRAARVRKQRAKKAAYWVFAFFLLAGNFKDLAFFSAIPVDLTLFLASITLAIVLYNVLKRGTIPRAAVTTAVVFFLIVLPGALQAPASTYASEKVLYFLTLGTLALLTPIVLCRSRTDLDDLVWVLCGACSLVALTAILNPQASSDYEGAPILGVASSTIELGRAAGLVLIVAVVAMVTRRASWWVGVGFAVLGGTALLASGSRGPLAAAVAAILLGLVLAPGRRSKLTVVAAVLVAGGVLWIGLLNAPEYARARIESVTAGTTDSSIGVRWILFQDALQGGIEDPVGLGWGGFASITPYPDIYYPHNIVLEFLVEAGVLPTIAFIVWTSIAWWRARSAARDFPGLAAFVLLTFTLVNAQVSGDVNDNRMFWASMGLAIVSASFPWARRLAAPLEPLFLRADAPVSAGRT